MTVTRQYNKSSKTAYSAFSAKLLIDRASRERDILTRLAEILESEREIICEAKIESTRLLDSMYLQGKIDVDDLNEMKGILGAFYKIEFDDNRSRVESLYEKVKSIRNLFSSDKLKVPLRRDIPVLNKAESLSRKIIPFILSIGSNGVAP